MSKHVAFIDGKDNWTPPKNGNVQFSITQKQYDAMMADQEKKTKVEDVLSALDKGEPVSTLTASVADDWREYVAPLWLPQVHHLEIKTPDWAETLVPNSITVNRDPAFFLGIDPGDDDVSKPRIDFIAKGASVDKTMHDLTKKSENLRRWGTGWSIDKDDLADIPIDTISHRLAVYEGDRRIFRTNWVTAQMYEFTSGDYETTYDNAYTCEGTQTTGIDYNGETTTHQHGISIEDILKALHEFRTNLQNPEDKAMGRTVRGQGYYSADYLVLPPAALRDLALEAFRKGYSNLGPERLSSQVRQTAFLSELFQVQIVPVNSSRWLPEEPKTQGNWSFIDDGYILDSRAMTELRHSEGMFSQNWFIEDTRQFCWALTQRTNYVAQDPMALMRLQAVVSS